jgi:hypothetical protein
MEIIKTTNADIDAVFEIYNEATSYQKTVNNKSWRGFERALIETEITENRHFIIKEDDQIACTFVITFNDLIIWKEASSDPAIYLHRIATNPKFRGRSYVKKIIEWAKTYAKENGKSYIRLDTLSFCNIPLRDSYLYMRYGKYGIGMSLDWAIKNTISPVVYIHETTPFRDFRNQINNFHIIDTTLKMAEKSLRDRFFNNIDIPYNSDNDDLITNINRITLRTIQFFKNWKTIYQQTEIITYQEREWRYVPSLFDTNEKPIITKGDEDFQKIKNKEYKQKPHLPDYSLKIESLDDLRYVIIKTDDQRQRILNVLSKNFSDEQLKNAILSGKLLIIKDETIQNDF